MVYRLSDALASAASAMRAATASGCETYTAWFAATSTVLAPMRSHIALWAGGGIIRSSLATRYQLGLDRHADSTTAPLRASSPHGTWESATSARRSPCCSVLPRPVER